jgi:uncharacterized protein DUF1161
MKHLPMLLLVTTLTCPALAAATSCEDVKAQIAAKLDAKGVKNYTLDIVAADAVQDRQVVGSCDGGTQKIVYQRRT